MKKNNDLLIEILEYYEINCAVRKKNLNIPKLESNPTEEDCVGHIELLLDDKLLEGKIERYYKPNIIRVTSNGHRFLELSRKKEVWTVLKEGGGLTIENMLSVGQELLSSYIKKKVGLD